jgi:hypothetical protein
MARGNFLQADPQVVCSGINLQIDPGLKSKICLIHAAFRIPEPSRPDRVIRQPFISGRADP